MEEEYSQLHQTHSYSQNTSINDGDNDSQPSYMASSVLTASPYPYPDATQSVHEMHLALLYLLSNPEEFTKALEQTSSAHQYQYGGGSTPKGLSDWNQDSFTDGGSTIGGGSTYTTTKGNESGTNDSIPLPFVVFCDDAEVVLPQAHTASQLFGVERLEGIELEAAAGIHGISQLFLRWLALMPGGDHLNIIDPPGLTVMRIAGGRYRVTAAHRVVWTWMNEFAELDAEPVESHSLLLSSTSEDGRDDNNNNNNSPSKKDSSSSSGALKVGDLVTMTIVDVFETDNNGKLLSYCPTFDNRDIKKTTATTETIRKSSSKIISQLNIMANSETATRLNRIAKRGISAGFTAATSLAHQVMNERFRKNKKELLTTNEIDINEKDVETASSTATPSMTAKDFDRAMTKAEQETLGNPIPSSTTSSKGEKFAYEEDDDDDDDDDYDGPREI